MTALATYDKSRHAARAAYDDAFDAVVAARAAFAALEANDNEARYATRAECRAAHATYVAARDAHRAASAPYVAARDAYRAAHDAYRAARDAYLALPPA